MIVSPLYERLKVTAASPLNSSASPRRPGRSSRHRVTSIRSILPFGRQRSQAKPKLQCESSRLQSPDTPPRLSPREAGCAPLRKRQHVESLSSCTWEPTTGVCENNTPPDKKILGKLSLKNTKSGAGEEFLLLCCREKVLVKDVVFHRQRHGPKPQRSLPQAQKVNPGALRYSCL